MDQAQPREGARGHAPLAPGASCGTRSGDPLLLRATQKTPLCVLRAVPQYRSEHRDVRQGIDARRHARNLGAPGTYKTADWIWLFQLWNWTCAYCGARGAALQPEHRVPLARGCSNAIET